MQRELYQKIAQDANPIFLLGAGTYAVDVYRYCVKHQIKLAGVAVTTPVKGAQFCGFPVITLKDALHSYHKISVMIGFADFSKVENICQIEGIENLYFLPQVLYGRDEPIAETFLKDNKSIIESMYHNAGDELSRQCLESYFLMRTSQVQVKQLQVFDTVESYFNNSVFQLSKKEVLIDIGSFRGASIMEFLQATKGEYSQIIGIEPDPRNFEELKNKINPVLQKVSLFDCCIWREDGLVSFSQDSNLGGIKEIPCNAIQKEARSIDSLCAEYGIIPTIVELNFPFSVIDILKGMARTMQAHYPTLILRIAYLEETLVEAYAYILRNYPEYQVEFRYTQAVPQGLTMIAIKRKKNEDNP